MIKPLRFAVFAAVLPWFGGCVPTTEMFYPRSTFTGTITGVILNTQHQPVSGIYWSPCVHIIPPINSRYTVGETVTDAQGRFSLITSKKVEQLDAISSDWLSGGQLDRISQTGNTITIQSRAEWMAQRTVRR